MIVYEMVISSVAVTATLFYASYLDIRDRRVPDKTWYPMLAIGVPAALYLYLTIALTGRWGLVAGYFALCAIFSLIFYLFAAKNLFGGADAKALICIAACVPFFPFAPLSGYPPLGFLPLSVLTNAVILNLAAPAGIFAMNLKKGNRAPLPYMFFGFPVDGAGIRNTFGFVMEDFEEKDGIIIRRFTGIRESLRRMFSGKGRIYTRDLRLYPEKFKKELGLYKKAGVVWISYAVPFIVPITAGMISAIMLGDILFLIMKTVFGV
jgi:preflagellin peptidase FlaK